MKRKTTTDSLKLLVNKLFEHLSLANYSHLPSFLCQRTDRYGVEDTNEDGCMEGWPNLVYFTRVYCHENLKAVPIKKVFMFMTRTVNNNKQIKKIISLGHKVNSKNIK